MNRRDILRVASGMAALSACQALRAAEASPCPPSSLALDGRLSPSVACPGRVADPGSVPAWLQNKSLFEWVEIPNTKLESAQQGFSSPGGDKRGILAYSGAAIDAQASELYVIGGGHADYAGNEVYSLALSLDVPTWRRRNNPTATVNPVSDRGVSHYSDGRPSSRHTYWTCHFIESRNRLMTFGAPAVWGNGNGNFGTVDGFNPGINDYDLAGTYPSLSDAAIVSAGIAKDRNGNVYLHNHMTGLFHRWDASSNAWDTLGNRGTYNYETAYACDVTRNRILRLRGSSGVAEKVFDLNNGATARAITFSGPLADLMRSASISYDSSSDCFWVIRRGHSELYRIDPESWAVSLQPTTGRALGNTPAGGYSNIYGRFDFVPQLGGLVFVHDVNRNAFFIRTS